MRNWIIIFGILLFGVMPLTAQFSNKTDSSFKPISLQTVRDNENISIAYNNNKQYYVGWLASTKGDNEAIIYNYYLQLFDENGKKIWNTLSIFPMNDSDGELLACSPQLAVTSKGECIFSTLQKKDMLTGGSFTKISVGETKMVTQYSTETPENISFKLNQEDNICFVITYLARIEIGVIKSADMKFPESEEIISIVGATQPEIVAAKNSDFYVVYKMNNRLFVDKYDKNCQTIWKGVMIGDAKTNKNYLVEADGVGGIAVLWDTEKKLLLQHLDANGMRLDTATIISNSVGNKYVMSVDTTNYNVNVSWQEENSMGQKLIKAQKVTSTGEKLWNDGNGIAFNKTQSASQNMPVAIASVAPNRSIITMLKYNSTTSDYDMVIAKLTDEGENIFGDLKLINNERSDRGYMFDRKNTFVTTGFVNNQIVVAWLDSANTIIDANNTNLCLQNFSYYGDLGEGINTQSIQSELLKVDNKEWQLSMIINGQFNFEYNSDISKNIALHIYYITGEKVAVLDNISLQEGYNNLFLNANLSTGTYIIRIGE